MTAPIPPKRPSGIYPALERGIAAASVIFVGIVFMVVGFGLAVYLAESATRAKPPLPIPKFAYAAGALGVVGALTLPSVFNVIFPKVQAIYVLIFPNGLPLLGGRRSTDPQPKP